MVDEEKEPEEKKDSPSPQELADLMARYKALTQAPIAPVEPLSPGAGVLTSTSTEPVPPQLPPTSQSVPADNSLSSTEQEDTPSGPKDEQDEVPTVEEQHNAKDQAKIEAAPENPQPTQADQSDLIKMLQPSQASPQLDPNAMLKDAQKQRNIRQLLTGLSQAGNMIGSGIAGQHGAYVKPLPEDYYAQDYKNANQPVEDLKEKLAAQGDDPNSEVSKSAQAYATKLGIKLPGPVSANTLFKILPIQEKFMASQDANATRRDTAKYRADSLAAERDATSANREASQADKKNKDDITRIDKASKLISAETSSSRSSFGKAANTYRAGEALDQLAGQAQTQPGGLDNRQMAEVARNLDSMLSNGQPSVSGMDKLLPNTATGDIAHIQEYISNLPKGAEQQQFLQRAMETVKREKDLAKSQMQRTQGKLLAPYQDLKDHPNMKSVLEANGLPDDLFESPAKKGKATASDDSDKKTTGFNISDPKDLTAVQTIMKNNPGISQQDAINALVKHKQDQGL